MEKVYRDNVARYQSLVAAYKPPEYRRKADEQPNPDMVVSARIRPMLEDEVSEGIATGVFVRNSKLGVVDLHELRKTVRWGPQLRSFNFKLDQLYGPENTTEEVYESLVKPLIPWAWGGGVGTLFACGQTGSGKTFTVSGLEQLTAEYLMGGQLEGERNIYVSIVELAGNSVYDLLNERKPISVLEDSFGVTQLAGALEHRIDSKDSLLDFISTAASFRKTALTMKNDASSRSHAICRIRLANPNMPSAKDGLLYLIDLAGSEAARDISAHGAERMRETREINTSLSILKDCIRGRADADAAIVKTAATRKGLPAKKPHVPFRQSALTKILKHVFDPAETRSCKTAVVACVNPNYLDVGASKNTLRYAETLRVILPKADVTEYNPALPATWSNEVLQEWINNNSGRPPIIAKLLAPTESGIQLLRLPAPEFFSRCLKTPGIEPEQARAFRSKFWRLHVDSHAGGSKASVSEPRQDADSAHVQTSHSRVTTTSHDPMPGSETIPFTERIRPGMVVRWSPPAILAMPGVNMAVILSAKSAIDANVLDVNGQELDPSRNEQSPQAQLEKNSHHYICAVVSPGAMADAYEVNLWQQVVISIDEMEAEVLLEYDAASRYYFVTV